MLSRKDYKAIARIVEMSAGDAFGIETKAAMVCVAINLADYFAKDSPLFNRDKFLSACSIEPKPMPKQTPYQKALARSEQTAKADRYEAKVVADADAQQDGEKPGHKTIYDGPGKCKTVPCKDHSYAWSGTVPCTGIYRCIYCGKPAPNHR